MQHITLIQFPKNQGKGAAVKAGMLSASGDLRLFMDADGSTQIRELTKLLPYVSEGFDVVVGSRLISGAVKKTKQNLTREFLGWVFRNLTQLIMRTDVEDPQNGFKLFTANATEHIFGALTTKGWSFDVEVLALAKKYHLRVKEVPIVWVNDERSRIRFPHMVRMLLDLLWIRWRY
jgi:glycosyltransferase involved in cell wall biosynthesis